MKVYIDTNVFIKYLSTRSSIETLKKLKKFIKEGKIELVLTSQTKKEVTRRSKEKIELENKRLKELKERKAEIDVKQKPHYRDELTSSEKRIIEKIKSKTQLLEKEVKKYDNYQVKRGRTQLKEANRLIKEILRSGIVFKSTDELVWRGIYRYAKDLPPKKDNGKFGDSIIWETLGENIKTESLIIVTDDRDYFESGSLSEGEKEGEPNRQLVKEWNKNTGKDLKLYPSLGYFLNTLDKKNPVSEEDIRDEIRQTYIVPDSDAISLKVSPAILSSGDVNAGILTGAGGGYATSNVTGVQGGIAGFSNTTEPISVLASQQNSVTRLNVSSNSVLGTPDYTGAITGEGHYIGTQDENILNLSAAGSLYRKCEKCGKKYTESIGRVYIHGWCDDCSNRSTLGLS